MMAYLTKILEKIYKNVLTSEANALEKDKKPGSKGSVAFLY